MLLPLPRKLMMATAVAAAMILTGPVPPGGALAADGALVVSSGNPAVAQSVKVGLNRSLVIDLPRDARDILVSNPVIADAVIRTPRRIYVTGVAVGQSNVIVFDRAGAQIVALELQVERDSTELSRMIARLIPNSSVNVEVVSDNIVLTGSVKNASDARKAQDIAAIFVNGGAQVQQQNAQQTAGAGGGGQGLSVSLSQSSNTPTSKVINMLAIEGEDQVQIKVTVAEVQRNTAKQLGVELSGSISAGGIVAGILTSNPFSVSNKPLSNNQIGIGGSSEGSLAAVVRLLEQTGVFKTLAEPTLTAISGESATFLAGGEFPVPVGRSRDEITIEFKPYGVALAFTPVVLSEGRISLRVKTEVSELTSEGSLILNGGEFQSDLVIPGLKVRRADTTLELPSGGSMVLGGLLQDNARQSVGALPGLGKLPVLGPLFRSRDFLRNETELVILITPYLVKPVSRSVLATPDQGFSPASDAQTILLGNINRVYGASQTTPGASYQYRGPFGFIFE